jgi:hypothetical protein
LCDQADAAAIFAIEAPIDHQDVAKAREEEERKRKTADSA